MNENLPILITQRVVIDPERGERLDVLDQAWYRLLAAAGLGPVPVPNHDGAARRLLDETPVGGLLLTGGNSLAAYGGDAPERDEVESLLLRRALAAGVPVLGVCRGMEFLLDVFGVRLEEVEGHVTGAQTIRIDGEPAEVNSFHGWGCHAAGPEFEVWAEAEDGVVKAVRHREFALHGVMWHPERIEPFRAADIALLQTVFAPRARPEPGS